MSLEDILANQPRNGEPSTSKHLPGPWKVIRTGGITIAQGYLCSCGVIGCSQMREP